jgi:hypothetical protein
MGTVRPKGGSGEKCESIGSARLCEGGGRSMQGRLGLVDAALPRAKAARRLLRGAGLASPRAPFALARLRRLHAMTQESGPGGPTSSGRGCSALIWLTSSARHKRRKTSQPCALSATRNKVSGAGAASMTVKASLTSGPCKGDPVGQMPAANFQHAVFGRVGRTPERDRFHPEFVLERGRRVDHPPKTGAHRVSSL